MASTGWGSGARSLRDESKELRWDGHFSTQGGASKKVSDGVDRARGGEKLPEGGNRRAESGGGERVGKTCTDRDQKSLIQDLPQALRIVDSNSLSKRVNPEKVRLDKSS